MGAPGVRRRATILAAVTMLVVLPWYVQVPASIARWRITGGWLDGALAWPGALSRPLALAGTLVGGMSELGGWHWADVVAMATGAAIVFELVRRGSGGRAFSRPAGLLWLSLAGACVGPLVFDLLRHTTAIDDTALCPTRPAGGSAADRGRDHEPAGRGSRWPPWA